MGFNMPKGLKKSWKFDPLKIMYARFYKIWSNCFECYRWTNIPTAISSSMPNGISPLRFGQFKTQTYLVKERYIVKYSSKRLFRHFLLSYFQTNNIHLRIHIQGILDVQANIFLNRTVHDRNLQLISKSLINPELLLESIVTPSDASYGGCWIFKCDKYFCSTLRKWK